MENKTNQYITKMILELNLTQCEEITTQFINDLNEFLKEHNLKVEKLNFK